MNKAILIGNLTKDPQVNKTQSGLSVVKFTLAVTKRMSEGKEHTDFIPCVAWRQTADIISQYTAKGSKIAVEGEITTGSYDDKTTGKKVYTTDVTVDRVELLTKSEKKDDNVYGNESLKPKKDVPDFDTGPTLDIVPDDLPF